MGSGLSRPFGSALNAIRFPAGRPAIDTGVSVLAVVLRFIFGILVILAVLWVIREVLAAIRGHRASTPPPPNPAVTELEMLYVRGEVSRTDYLTRRSDLTGVPYTAPPPV